jgi:hypothetical protein
LSKDFASANLPIVTSINEFDKILATTNDGKILARCGRALLENRQYTEARKFFEKAAAAPNSPLIRSPAGLEGVHRHRS